MKLLCAFILVALASVHAASADRMSALSYLVGTWNCTYSTGGHSSPYTATYEYVMDRNWMRERDVWSGGSVDNFLTYDAQKGAWRVAIMRNDRTMQVFVAPDTGTHLAYRSVYPDASQTSVFDKLSATHYTQTFQNTSPEKVMSFSDDCRKAGT